MWHQRLILGLATSALLASAAPSIAGRSPTGMTSVVDLGYAQYQGISNSTLGLTTYYGLQYAAPPTGAQRWQPPVPIENSTVLQNSSSRIINATVPSYQCVQSGPYWIGALSIFSETMTSNRPQSEDCLRLDVIVPNSPVSTSLPVVIQIHGGGYTIGSSTTYDGSFFTSYSNGSVIYVQIQYRLGFYGFLGSEAVRSNGVANAGLVDQRAALEWVQRHIAAFGGDPTQVTIWGGSAGGGSVTAQMQLYGGDANPPFRAAIAEYPWWQPFHSDDVLEAQYQQLLQASNCTDLVCLRALSAQALVQANAQTYILGGQAGTYGYGDFYAGPSVDGEIIKELPSAAFANGRYSKVPMLIDHDAFEGAIFTNLSVTSEAQIQPNLATIWQTNSTSFFNRLFQLYPLSDFEGAYFANNSFFAQFASEANVSASDSPYWQSQAVFGDFIINCPTYYIGSAVGGDAQEPVWKLIFATGTELHGATSPFLLSPNEATMNPTLAAQMKSYFLAFAANLDPNSAPSAAARSHYATSDNNSTGASRPNWPTYLSRQGAFTILQVNATSISTRNDTDVSGRCDFFHGQSAIVRN